MTGLGIEVAVPFHAHLAYAQLTIVRMARIDG